MMYLISGLPGNGKSLRAMWQMQQEYERNRQANKEGKEDLRRFFTNIAGATTDENPDAFPWVEKLPDHNDWTKLPDGSFVVYDEAHSDGKTPGLERYGELFPSTGKPGESSDMRIRAMSTHRHRGFDLLFLTQWPNKIHHQVRTLIGSHVHMNRGMGLEAAGVLTWARVQTNPYDEKEREKAEEEIWRYVKDLYRRYKSSSLHTASHKFKIPKKVISGICTVVVAIVVLWALFHWIQGFGMRKVEDAPESEQAVAQGGASLIAPVPPADSAPSLAVGIGSFASIKTEPVATLAGCVSSDRGCRCFNSDGFQIDMSPSECKVTMESPLPFNVYHEYRAPAGATGSTQGHGGGVVAEGVVMAAGDAYKPPAVGSGSDQFARAPLEPVTAHF